MLYYDIFCFVFHVLYNAIFYVIYDEMTATTLKLYITNAYICMYTGTFGVCCRGASRCELGWRRNGRPRVSREIVKYLLLLKSTKHAKRPESALRDMTQFRGSWGHGSLSHGRWHESHVLTMLWINNPPQPPHPPLCLFVNLIVLIVTPDTTNWQ